jgi:hypothetical protein
MAMIRWHQARRPERQHDLPVWAEPTMLAELHALKLPVGTVGSPSAGGRRVPGPGKPANYITVMMRRARVGAVPGVVRSARRVEVRVVFAGSAATQSIRLRGDEGVAMPRDCSQRFLSGGPRFAGEAIFPLRYAGGAAQLDSRNRIRARRGGCR